MIQPDHYHTPYTKINSKWIKNLSVRPATMKFIEENISCSLIDISLRGVFVDLIPKARKTKAKIKK